MSKALFIPEEDLSGAAFAASSSLSTCFEPGFIIKGGPEYSWRSSSLSTNNLTITLDSNRRVMPNAIAVFGYNASTLKFQISSSSSFSTLLVDKSLDFTIATGRIDSMSGAIVTDSTLSETGHDYSLAGKLFTLPTGFENVWEIGSNVDSNIFLKDFSSLATSDVETLYSTPATLETSVTLLALWKFDDASGATAEDSSDNNNHGTLSTTSVPTWTTGKSGGALSFTGEQFVKLLDEDTASSLIGYEQSGATSISFWFKSTTDSGSNRASLLSRDKTSYWEFVVDQSESSGSQSVKMNYNLAGGEGPRGYVECGGLDTDTWYHVVGIIDHDVEVMYLYVNAEYKDSVRNSRCVGDGDEKAVYAAANYESGSLYEGSHQFVGELDEIRIYGGALRPPLGEGLIYEVLNDSCAATFSLSTPSRYMRFRMEPQENLVSHYKIGYAVIGRAVIPEKNWAVGFSEDSINNIDFTEGRTGNLLAVYTEYSKAFRLVWKAEKEDNNLIMSFLDFVEDRKIAVIPDSDDKSECYLTYFSGNVEEKHINRDRIDLSVSFIERK